MDFVLHESRALFDSFDVYTELLSCQEYVLYQCMDAEMLRDENIVCGDYNSGKRKVLTWLVRITGGPTLIVVNSKINFLKWKHHFDNWPGQVDFLHSWKTKSFTRKLKNLKHFFYKRVIVDDSRWKPSALCFDKLWYTSKTSSLNALFLPSPFSFSLFHSCACLTLKEWKSAAARETRPLDFYTFVPFLEKSDKKEVSGECPVCRDVPLALVTTHCGHKFCPDCLFATFLFQKFTCPMCRACCEKTKFSLESNLSIVELVIEHFLKTCDDQEYAVVYDPLNACLSIPIAWFGEKQKVSRIVRISSPSFPLPHVTHLFSLSSITTELLKKYFSTFDRETILKLVCVGN